MLSKILLAALTGMPLAYTHELGRVQHLEIRQATTTPITSATDATACHLPASLLDNSIYEGQPTGSQDLDNWLRALPCDEAACCIPASLSKDWADYVSDSYSWWSDHSSAIEERTSQIVSWYSSAAQLPACATIVHPITTTSLANPADPLGLTCPTATGSTQAGASTLTRTSASSALAGESSTSVSLSSSASASTSTPASASSSANVQSSSSAGDPIAPSFIVGSMFSYYALLFSVGIFALAVKL